MRRIAILSASLFFILGASTVWAQHSGHGMGGGMGTGSSAHDNSAMRDMQRMMAVQATDEQKSQFRSWNESTESLRKQLLEVQSSAGASDVASKIAALKTSTEELKKNKAAFDQSLSATQQKGLKKPLDKVNKADSQLAQAVSEATRNMDQHGTKPSDFKKAAQAAEKLAVAQKKLAEEMGI